MPSDVNAGVDVICRCVYFSYQTSTCRHIIRPFQERMKVREVIPHIGPIPIVIPLKLFLEGIDFLADNVTSRVTCLSPFSILQRLITIIHFYKRNCFSRYFKRISKKYT